MDIRSLSKLSHREVVDLGRAAADRGESLDGSNPFASNCWRHAVFADAHRAREAELQPVA